MADVSVVVVTYNALPYLTQCLDSVPGYETVVVDHGSTDDTVEHVRERFPDVKLVEQENLGLAAGWNVGMRHAAGRYFLLLNADAWPLDDAIAKLVDFAETRPDAAAVGPRLRYPDGRLQPSVRAFPTLWRLATDYLFLRKLAPGSRALNAFYGGGFDHNEIYEADWVVGACLLVRREAVEQVGPVDESYFLFNEETDWCYRCRQAGWKVYFYPAAEVVHVGSAAHQNRFFREQVRGYLVFFAKHHGWRQAQRARSLMLFAFRIRGLLFRGVRGQPYRDAARWLATGSADALLGRGGEHGNSA
jgi:N-acetylglucosaminyl-diphospho-decaprenol L-rhamnosyltransferase